MPWRKKSSSRSALGAGELAGELDELGVAVAHARAHELVVAGGVGLVLEHQVVAVGRRAAPCRRGPSPAARPRSPPARAPRDSRRRRARKVSATRSKLRSSAARNSSRLFGNRLNTYGWATPTRRAMRSTGGAVQAAVGELVHGGGDQLLAALGGRDPPARAGSACGVRRSRGPRPGGDGSRAPLAPCAADRRRAAGARSRPRRPRARARTAARARSARRRRAPPRPPTSRGSGRRRTPAASRSRRRR